MNSTEDVHLGAFDLPVLTELSGGPSSSVQDVQVDQGLPHRMTDGWVVDGWADRWMTC